MQTINYYGILSFTLIVNLCMCCGGLSSQKCRVHGKLYYREEILNHHCINFTLNENYGQGCH